MIVDLQNGPKSNEIDVSVIKVEKIYTKNAQSAIIRKKQWKTMLYNLSEETEDYLKLIFSRQMHKSQDPETKAVIGRQKYEILHSDWLTQNRQIQKERR